MPITESIIDADCLRQEYRRLAGDYPHVSDPHEKRACYRRLLGILQELRAIEGASDAWCGLPAVLPPWQD